MVTTCVLKHDSRKKYRKKKKNVFGVGGGRHVRHKDVEMIGEFFFFFLEGYFFCIRISGVREPYFMFSFLFSAYIVYYPRL